jgi:hypothetical protein
MNYTWSKTVSAIEHYYNKQFDIWGSSAGRGGGTRRIVRRPARPPTCRRKARCRLLVQMLVRRAVVFLFPFKFQIFSLSLRHINF